MHTVCNEYNGEKVLDTVGDDAETIYLLRGLYRTMTRGPRWPVDDDEDWGSLPGVMTN
jgi:hypothetical protein